MSYLVSLVISQSHSVDYEVDVGAKTGRLLRTEFECHVNAGMSAECSSDWIRILTFRLDGGYTLKRFKSTCKAYKTNTQSNTAFRGFGGPEGQVHVYIQDDHGGLTLIFVDFS